MNLVHRLKSIILTLSCLCNQKKFFYNDFELKTCKCKWHISYDKEIDIEVYRRLLVFFTEFMQSLAMNAAYK